MTLRTFYAYEHEAPPEPEADPDYSDDPHSIAWGYNLADLERLARISVSRSRSRAGNAQDRYEAAWSAIAEALCTASNAPNPTDLIAAGTDAAIEQAHKSMVFDGASREGGRRQRYVQYWAVPVGASAPVEERIVESMALWSILPLLSPRQWAAVKALAATEDYDLAAASLGYGRKSYSAVISRARSRFLSWWLEGETPPKRRKDQRRPSGNRGTQPGRITDVQLDQIRSRHHAGETQEAIAADYGVARSTITQLLSGVNRPARSS